MNRTKFVRDDLKFVYKLIKEKEIGKSKAGRERLLSHISGCVLHLSEELELIKNK